MEDLMKVNKDYRNKARSEIIKLAAKFESKVYQQSIDRRHYLRTIATRHKKHRTTPLESTDTFMKFALAHLEVVQRILIEHQNNPILIQPLKQFKVFEIHLQRYIASDHSMTEKQKHTLIIQIEKGVEFFDKQKRITEDNKRREKLKSRFNEWNMMIKKKWQDLDACV